MRHTWRTPLVLLLFIVAAAIAGVLGTQPVAEARRIPATSAARRWLPPEATPTRAVAGATETPTPTPTSTPSAAATASQPLAASTVAVASPTSTVPVASPTPKAGFADDFESVALGASWADGTTHGVWRTLFAGYGTVGAEVDGDRVLSLSPLPAVTSSETHAALVVSTTIFTGVDFTVQVKTASQLRSPQPNAWEAGWVLWNFTDEQHFYYVALKPNGLEIGKEDPAYPGAQRFLVTLSAPAFRVGEWSTLRVKHVGNSFTVWVNGSQLAAFTDTERPYPSGAVGLYTEDADVHFNNVVVVTP